MSVDRESARAAIRDELSVWFITHIESPKERDDTEALQDALTDLFVVLSGDSEPTPLDLVQAISNARHRWERYVADCNPVQELDEHGRTLDQAIADRVRALIGDGERTLCPICGQGVGHSGKCFEAFSGDTHR